MYDGTNLSTQLQRGTKLCDVNLSKIILLTAPTFLMSFA